MLHYIHVIHHTIILNQNRSFRNKRTFNHSTVLLSTSLRLRGLAQARQSRSGEGSKRGNRNHCGISLRRDPSRLGEWFARSKWKSWSPGRPWAKKAWASLRQTRLGEPDSPGRDYQVSPWIHLQLIRFSNPLIIHSIPRTPNNNFIHGIMQQVRKQIKTIQNRSETTRLETLTSRTWKRVNGTSTRDLGVRQLAR